MQIKKKYAQLINFINLFNKYTDGNEYVDISSESYDILKEFAQSVEVNNLPEYEPEQQEQQNDDSEYEERLINIEQELLTFNDTLSNINDRLTNLENNNNNSNINEQLGDINNRLSNLENNSNINEQLSDISNRLTNLENNSIELPSNIVTSNIDGVKINLVDSIPNNTEENTLYIVI